MNTEQLQAIADAYTQGVHVDDICDAFDITQDEFAAIRRQHRLRRGKPALIAFDVEDVDDVEAAIEHLSRTEREALVEKKARRRAKLQIENDARSWQELERALEEAHERFEERWTGYSVPRMSSAASKEECALVLQLQDLHVGKMDWRGEGDIEQYVDTVVEHIARILRKARRSADLKRIYVGVGGDLFHVDNAAGTTTAGTAQDLLTTPEMMLLAGQMLMVRIVDLCRGVCDTVELVYIRGNHDAMLSLSAYAFCRAWYRHCPEVVVHEDYAPRQYRVFGESLLVFTHGDLARSQATILPQIIAQEARELWGRTGYTYVFSGHRHFEEMTQDAAGTVTYQTPTSTKTDRWHKRVGYTGSRRALQGVIIPARGEDRHVITVAIGKSATAHR